MEEVIIALNNIKIEVDRVKQLLKEYGNCQSCILCDYWNQPKAICGKYNSLPPPKIIFSGCDEFKKDIPF